MEGVLGWGSGAGAVVLGVCARAGLPGVEGMVLVISARAGLPGVEGAGLGWVEGVVLGVSAGAGLPGVEQKTLERVDWLSRSRLSFNRLYFFRLAASFTTGGWSNKKVSHYSMWS